MSDRVLYAVKATSLNRWSNRTKMREIRAAMLAAGFWMLDGGVLRGSYCVF